MPVSFKFLVSTRICISALRGALQLGDVELLHLHHCLHPFGMLDELRQARGNNLPAQAKFIYKPAALDFFSAGGELRPIVVDFLLRFAAHDERDCGSKLVSWAAV